MQIFDNRAIPKTRLPRDFVPDEEALEKAAKARREKSVTLKYHLS
jgi:hypothetical protein